MTRPSTIWIILFVVYALFFAWYTSFGGPLSAQEIEAYLAVLRERGGQPPEIDQLRRFLEEDSGDDFVMVNVIELREPPTMVEGVRPGDTASEVLDRYMEYMWPALLRRACHPVVVGWAASPALDVWGIENAGTWTQAGLMRYRSRRDMMDIATHPEFAGRHELKTAAMLKTIAFPIDPWFQLGDPRLLLALVLLVIGFAVQRPASRQRPRLG